jgi:hypothetical protein
MRRWLIRLGVGAVVLVVVLVVAAKLLLRSGFAAHKVEAQLEAVTGGAPVHVGSLDVGATGSSLHDLQFAEAGAAEGSPPWASVPTVDADIPLTQLIRGEFSGGVVTLRGPKLTFRLDRESKLVTKLPNFGGPSHAWPEFRIVDGQITFLREGGGDAVFSNVSGTVRKAGEHITLDAAAHDSDWGDWKITGDQPDANAPFRLTLHTDEVQVTPEKLQRVPFVPPETWNHVTLTGPTPVDLALQFGGSGDGPAVRYRVALAPRDMTVRVPTIGLTTRDTSGKAQVEDGVVTLTDVFGKAASGSLHVVKSVMDFRGEGSEFRFNISADRLVLRELPAKWGLPALDGRMSGRADLTITVHNGQVKTSGGGSGTVEGFLSQTVQVKMVANERGYRFDISNTAARPKELAPKGRPSIAGGGAQRNPRIAEAKEWSSPNGAIVATVGRPSGAPNLVDAVLRGFRCASPPAINGRPFGAASRDTRSAPTGIYNDSATALTKLLATGLVTVQPADPRANQPANNQTIRINLGLKDVSLSELVQKLDVKIPIRLDGRLTFNVHATIPLSDARDLKAYHAVGTVDLPWARIEDLWLQKVKAKIVFENGVLRLHELSAHEPNSPPAAPPTQLLPGGTVLGTASVGISPSGDLTANLKITALPIGQLLRAVPNADPNGAGTADGEVEFRAPAGALRDVQKWQGSGRLVGRGLRAFGRSADEISLRANLAAGVLHVAEARVQLPGSTVTGTGQLTLSGQYPYQAHVDLPPSDLKAWQEMAPELRSVQLAGNAKVTADAHGTLSPMTVNADGTAHVDGLAVQSFKVGTLDFRWDLDPDRLHLSDFAAALYGGQLTGTATLPLKPTVGGKVDLTLGKLNTANLTKDLPQSPVRLEGNAQGSVVVNLPAAGPNGRREITADVAIQAEKLRIQNIPADRLKANVVYRNGAADYKIQGETLGGTFDINGRYPSPPANAPGEQGRLNVRGIRLSRLADALRMESLRPLAGRFDLDANFTAGDGNPAASGRLLLSNLSWGGKPLADRFGGAATLAGGVVRMDDLSGQLAGGMVRCRFTYDVRHPERSSAMVVLERIDAKTLLAPFAESPPLDGPLEGRLYARLGREWTGQGSIRMGYGKLAGITVRDLQLPIGWDFIPGRRGQLRLHDASAQASRGRLTGQAEVQWGETARLTGQVRFNGIDVGELISHYSQSQALGGLATGRIDFAGREMRSIRDLSARVEAKLAQTVPSQTPVFRQVMPMLMPGVGANTQFQSGDLRGTLGGGVFRIERLSLVGDLARIYAEGTVTLQQRLNLDVIANTNQLGIDPAALRLLGIALPAFGPIPLATMNQAVSYLSNRTISLRVTGTIRAPSIQVNPVPFLTDTAVRFFLAQTGVPIPTSALQAPPP